MYGIMRRVQAGIGCIHGEELAECEHCTSEWAELDRWQVETDQWWESVRLGEAPLDGPMDWLAYCEREAGEGPS